MDAVSRAIESLRRAPLGDPAYDDGPVLPGSVLPGSVLPGADVLGADVLGADVPSRGSPSAAAFRAAAVAASLGAFVELAAVADPDPDLGPGTGPLAGVTVAIKDVFDVAGQRVGNGTAGFGHRTADHDSAAWGRLRSAGAVLVGRTRLPELAWSVVTPGCRNPWSPDRGVGGSSGGSAVAVASGAAKVALGTDTGGSIRIPAALCGLAGLRPTVGTISRLGVTPLAPTMDTVGPLALTAADCLLVHQILAGPVLATPAPGDAVLGDAVRPDPAAAAGLRVGWPIGLWRDRVTPDVSSATEAAAAALRGDGVEVVTVELPLATAYARAAAYVIILAESAALWHGALSQHPAGLSQRTAELLRAGAAVPVPDYLRSLRVAHAIRREVDAVFHQQRLAALLLPTVPTTAARLGAESVEIAGRQVAVETAYAYLAALASVTGLPALSVPSGLDRQGLPAGAQLIGPGGTESVLCLLGTVIERSPGGRAVAMARDRLAARQAAG
jgi:Asp-tRNA(Asn)/Glu-tRNA(Gln) amidotransferase A subunit family amidase